MNQLKTIMTENVSNEIRKIEMEKILSKPSNQICFDCGSKFPKWSSPYLGIVICYDCAGRHRSYGSHISFVRSIELDKWTRKQLRSLEITGNDYTKEKFIQMGIPKEGNFFDYNCDLVLKYRNEINCKVKEDLENNPSLYREKNNDNEKFKNSNFVINDNINKIQTEKNENINNNNIKNNDNLKNEEEKKNNDEIQKPIHFEIHTNAKIDNLKIQGKTGKKNKIKKVDFDFDFDSFNNINFSDFNNKNEEEEKQNKQIYDDIEEEEKIREKKSKNKNLYNIKISKEEINQKFKNKKAISSEDYALLEENNSNDKFIKNKIKSMSNSQAISSDDIYGISNDYYSEESFGDLLKDFAINFTLKAAEKAKELKNITDEFLNKIQNEYEN